MVKLLDEGKIPSRLVGKYRRVRFDDLMAFKRKDDQARSEVLDQLAQEAQELGLGYERKKQRDTARLWGGFIYRALSFNWFSKYMEIQARI